VAAPVGAGRDGVHPIDRVRVGTAAESRRQGHGEESDAERWGLDGCDLEGVTTRVAGAATESCDIARRQPGDPLSADATVPPARTQGAWCRDVVMVVRCAARRAGAPAGAPSGAIRQLG
jgi:hypothetical protein